MRTAPRLLLLTAVRSQELRLARWADVDLEAGTWTIPVANQKLTLEQAKSAPPFIIPITPTARALFEELRSLAGDSPWVLPSDGRTDAHEGHYPEKAIGKYMARLWPHPKGKWAGLPELRDMPRASPHDLRRTARTWLGKIGVLPHIAERCLNHKLAGGGQVERTYDRGSYFDDRRAALERWDACLRQRGIVST